MNKLIIVESPAKAKTITKYLESLGEYTVKSSVGHIRDLPKENDAIKITAVGQNEWEFKPKYIVTEDKKKVVNDLNAAVKKADEIYLASDPDREGEAIAWHLKEVLMDAAKDKPFYRITYHEVTKSAILKAIEQRSEINKPLVDAQQARRIIDRLVGYKVSPLLWKNISCANNKTLSAGRVQSVALRLLVERQREIDAFIPETYFLLGVEAKKRDTHESFIAKLSRYDGEKPEIRDRQTTDNILLDLADASLSVSDIKDQPKTRRPYPPFTTSTLQQAASSFLSFSPGKTMSLAQTLFEKGLITYHRTDSVNISLGAQGKAKDFIVSKFGEEYYPPKTNVYKTKQADAQEAHEAIRPTVVERTPKTLGEDGSLESAAVKLYDLIWRRFVASQMKDAKTTVRTAYLTPVKPGIRHSYVFTASATTVDFDGFLKVMNIEESKKKSKIPEDDSDEIQRLPELKTGEELDAARYLADEKKTKGPKNYSEASLIKALEENGVGRPSTYAATIETLKNRLYAKVEKRKFVPLERGILVCDWLVSKLDSLFNVGYTAKMEADLDKIEACQLRLDNMLSLFYSKFSEELENCKPPVPDAKKFEFVFSLLDSVQNWKEPIKRDRHIYDDKVFVQNIKEKFLAGNEMSMRQFEVLVRLVIAYSKQIPDAEEKLKSAGILANARTVVERADPELVNYCFRIVDEIKNLSKNPFVKSLRDQYDKGRGLTAKQFSVLAKTVGENCAALPDCDEIRDKLSGYVEGGFTKSEAQPEIAGIFELLKGVETWRPKAKRGRKIYDDKSFCSSLADQFSRRGSLSELQIAALKRMARSYAERIPNFWERAEKLGIKRMPGIEDSEKNE